MRKQRRIGEALTIAGGIGIAIVGMLVSVPPVSYAGSLCIGPRRGFYILALVSLVQI